MREAVETEVDDVRGDLFLGRRAGVEPPLGGPGDHPDQGLRVHTGGDGVEPAGDELLLEDVGHAGGGVVEQGRIRAPTHGGRFAHKDAEAVRALLDVAQQRHRRALDAPPRPLALQRLGDLRAEVGELAVAHDRVEPLLASEVLVDHRLGHPRRGGDVLHRRGVVAVLGEDPSADLHQLMPPLGGGHPGPRCRYAHARHAPPLFLIPRG